MPKHPCEDGLTPACFKAYPKWARQALAYKLLHILVPKQLTKRLPKGLRLALIDPGAIIPPGLEIPPGMAIPPDFSYPEEWSYWDAFDYDLSSPPWDLLPEGWSPGDPLPPGVELKPGVEPPTTPPPATYPPPAYDTGHMWKEPWPWPGIIPPDYTKVWSPGPIFAPRSSPVGFDVGTLLINQGPNTNNSRSLGHAWYAAYMALRITTMGHYKIRAVDLRVGKNGAPDGSIQLEIWQAGTDYKPINILIGGTSNSKANDSLPTYSHSQEYVRFLFTSKPECFSGLRYVVVLHTTNTIDPANYLNAGMDMSYGRTYYLSQDLSTWYSQGGYEPTLKIWGELG